MDVNMVVSWHDRKETAIGHNYSIRGTGQNGYCCHQGALRYHIRQRCDQACLAGNPPPDQAASPSTPLQIRNAAFLPALKGRGILRRFLWTEGQLQVRSPWGRGTTTSKAF